VNLILLFEEDFVSRPSESHGRVQLDGRRADYVRAVHRAAPGDELCVGLEGGAVGTGRLLSTGGEAVEMEVVLDRPPPDPLPLTLILALPRPLVLKRALIAATSMGVKRILLVNARRVEKSFWQSTAMEPDAIRQQLVVGLEQARDTHLPEVLLRPRFRPFVEDEVPGWLGDRVGLVADPGGAEPCPRAIEGESVLAIGPEGGWIDFELECFAHAGFRSVHLGDRILRVETVLPYLLARLS